MSRKSSIEGHVQRERIEQELSAGIAGAEIARRYGVSESAISRYKSSRMDALAQIIDPEQPDPSDVLFRMTELADSATKSRKLADLSGSAAMRARAQATELAALTAMAAKFGISDTAAGEIIKSTGALVHCIEAFVYANPDLAPALLNTMGNFEELLEVREILKNQLKKRMTA